jgi:hypothetical protein
VLSWQGHLPSKSMKHRLFLFFVSCLPALFAATQWAGKRDNPGPAVNDAGQQQLPVFNLSGDTLYFSQPDASGNYRIRYCARTQRRDWSPRQSALNLQPNTIGQQFVFNQLCDGSFLVNGHFGRGLKSVVQGKGLAFATTGSGQTNFASLPFREADTLLNSRFTVAFLYEPAKQLFLSVLRAGNEDLFVCTALNPQENDWSRLQWGSPQRLSVNTPFAESAPWLSADGTTLYFSSNRPSGRGGSDIYSATRTGSGWTDWTAPRNLGAPVNSTGNETSFTIDPWNGDAYFVSDSGTLGGFDIFRLKPDTLPKPTISRTASAMEAAS